MLPRKSWRVLLNGMSPSRQLQPARAGIAVRVPSPPSRRKRRCARPLTLEAASRAHARTTSGSRSVGRWTPGPRRRKVHRARPCLPRRADLATRTSRGSAALESPPDSVDVRADLLEPAREGAKARGRCAQGGIRGLPADAREDVSRRTRACPGVHAHSERAPPVRPSEAEEGAGPK